MSNEVCDIITLAGRFKNQTELQDYCNKQFEALTEAAKRICQLEEEVGHLKGLLITTQALSDGSQDATFLSKATPEEKLLAKQIELMQERSMSKELTLEETKRLDLLIKNKRLLKEDSRQVDKEPIQSNASRKELEELAVRGLGEEQ